MKTTQAEPATVGKLIGVIRGTRYTVYNEGMSIWTLDVGRPQEWVPAPAFERMLWSGRAPTDTGIGSELFDLEKERLAQNAELDGIAEFQAWASNQPLYRDLPVTWKGTGRRFRKGSVATQGGKLAHTSLAKLIKRYERKFQRNFTRCTANDPEDVTRYHELIRLLEAARSERAKAREESKLGSLLTSPDTVFIREPDGLQPVHIDGLDVYARAEPVIPSNEYAVAMNCKERAERLFWQDWKVIGKVAVSSEGY